jgi:hypothetical protein
MSSGVCEDRGLCCRIVGDGLDLSSEVSLVTMTDFGRRVSQRESLLRQWGKADLIG